MRMFLVVMGLVIIITTACGPPQTPISESVSSANPIQPDESRVARLLSEDSAVSILQTYLQECVLSWDVEYEPPIWKPEREMQRGAPVPSEQEQRWWMNLATGAIGGIAWSAQYHGVTELPNAFDYQGNKISAETWVVIGPGFRRAGSELAIVPGRW